MYISNTKIPSYITHLLPKTTFKVPIMKQTSIKYVKDNLFYNNNTKKSCVKQFTCVHIPLFSKPFNSNALIFLNLRNSLNVITLKK